MSTRRLWFGIGGALFVATAGVFLMQMRRGGTRQAAPITLSAQTPLGQLAPELRRGEGVALALLKERLAARSQDPARGLTEAEASEWIEVLSGLRAGFPKFAAFGRASALGVAGKILNKFAVEGAPGNWGGTLRPIRDLMIAGLGDRALDVRIAALDEVSRFWTWMPGRTLLQAEERTLEEWAESFYPDVVRRLADPEPKARAVAVSCLAHLPIEEAAPAIAYLKDADPLVRLQVLVSFAERSARLSEEQVLPMLYDSEPAVATTADRVLKARGLSKDQIALGKMIFHPKPEMRVSAIPFLKDRTDIDPIVWLIHLSRDGEESVRSQAVAALATHDVPEARQRLVEMAASDPSNAIRQLAGKFAPKGETTAALPPLPGSSSLNPKAN